MTWEQMLQLLIGHRKLQGLSQTRALDLGLWLNLDLDMRVHPTPTSERS